MDDIYSELESSFLPLLIKTPNNKNAFGTNMEKWTINPSTTSALHIQFFQFLGVLMGMGLRANHILSLNLPSFVWKQILGDPLTRADLAGIDAYCTQVFSFMLFSN